MMVSLSSSFHSCGSSLSYPSMKKWLMDRTVVHGIRPIGTGLRDFDSVVLVRVRALVRARGRRVSRMRLCFLNSMADCYCHRYHCSGYEKSVRFSIQKLSWEICSKPTPLVGRCGLSLNRLHTGTHRLQAKLDQSSMGLECT